MRLIAVDSFVINDFIGDDTPPYAILSHTWGLGEVTLQDVQAEFGGGDEEDPDHYPNTTSKNRATRKQGFDKIKYTCEQAAKDGLGWAWVDTCCIDKTSSTEVSEAINSMYRWYNRANICYAYLPDVTLESDSVKTSHLMDTSLKDAIMSSRWLTRGWTLQELLAPRDIVFYDEQWTRIGTRNGGLRKTLANATGIDDDCLASGDHARLANYSIATRMSRASRRSCTRTEDVAYCLMGVFDVNMPMLYGEGKKAFIRLQEEILKENEDHSLFAWVVPADSDRAWKPRGCFAESPRDFEPFRSLRIKLPKSSRGDISAIVKPGLLIGIVDATPPSKKEPCYLYKKPYAMQYFILNCLVDNGAGMSWIKIALLPVSTGVIHDGSIPRFCCLAIPRIEVEPVSIAKKNQEPKRVYIRKNLSSQEHNMFHHGTILFQRLQYQECDLTMTCVSGEDSPGFLMHKAAHDRGGIVHILMDPRITDTVKWAETEFRDRAAGYFTVFIGLNRSMIHCYVKLREALHRDVAIHRSATTVCDDYRSKHGRLAFDEFTISGRKYRVEVFHDDLPLPDYSCGGRLHLLVRFSVVQVLSTSSEPSNTSAQLKSAFKGLFSGK